MPRLPTPTQEPASSASSLGGRPWPRKARCNVKYDSLTRVHADIRRLRVEGDAEDRHQQHGREGSVEQHLQQGFADVHVHQADPPEKVSERDGRHREQKPRVHSPIGMSSPLVSARCGNNLGSPVDTVRLKHGTDQNHFTALAAGGRPELLHREPSSGGATICIVELVTLPAAGTLVDMTVPELTSPMVVLGKDLFQKYAPQPPRHGSDSLDPNPSQGSAAGQITRTS